MLTAADVAVLMLSKTIQLGGDSWPLQVLNRSSQREFLRFNRVEVEVGLMSSEDYPPTNVSTGWRR
jgi:hypothetical protein